MLVIGDLLHIVVDFAALCRRNVSTWLLTLVHILAEQRVDLAVQGLAIQCTLHRLLQLRGGWLDLFAKIFHKESQRTC